MKKIGTIIVFGLSIFTATAAVAQGIVNLAGPYRCVQGCAGPRTALVAQNGWQLSLVNDAGQQSKAWIDRPGRIWIQSWNEGAAHSPDGMTIQFDRGSVWAARHPSQADHLRAARPDVVVTLPRPSAWNVYQSLRRPYLCYLPSEQCDTTQRLANQVYVGCVYFALRGKRRARDFNWPGPMPLSILALDPIDEDRAIIFQYQADASEAQSRPDDGIDGASAT